MQLLNLYEIKYKIDDSYDQKLNVAAGNLEEATTKGSIVAVDKHFSWKPNGERVLTSVTKIGTVYT